MTLFILTGSGAEDARNPLWGHLYRSLTAMGHQVALFDPVLAPDSTRRGDVSHQFTWMLTAKQPERVFIVPTDEANDEMLVSAITAANIPYTVLNLVELALRQHPDGVEIDPLCNTELLTPFDTPVTVDALLIGAASPQRAAALKMLINAGLSVEVYGDGWDAFPALRNHAHGPVNYPQLPAVFATARVVLAMPLGDSSSVSITTSQTGPCIAALEAAACGIAVVALDAAVGELLTDDKECVIADTANVASIVEALKKDERKRVAIGSAARERVERDHSWKQQWMQLGVNEKTPSIEVTKDGPRVSVCTAVYNTEEYVGEMIESILGQTISDWELIIVNDGSPDGSRAVVEKYLGDPRIRLFDQPNIAQTGRFDLLWRSIEEHARGEFTSHIGSDDVAPPRRLELQLAVFDRDPTVDIVHGGAEIINSAGVPTGAVLNISRSYHSASLLRDEIRANMIASPTAMMRRSIEDVVGQWSMGFGCDYHFWLKAARLLRFRFVPETLVQYRVHQKSSSTSSSGVVNSQYEAIRLRQRERERNTIADIYPSLLWNNQATDRDWAAAYVDLGLSFCIDSVGAQAALEHFDAAFALLGAEAPPELFANVAYALSLAGLADEAQQALAKAGSLSHMSMSGQVQLYDPVNLSSVPFEIPADRAHEVVWWDGTTYARTRILLIVDWSNPSAIAYVLDQYLRGFVGIADVDLVIPSFGLTEDEVLTRLMPLFAADIDLENCSDVTVESYQRLDYIPLDRYAVVIDGSPNGLASKPISRSVAELNGLAVTLRDRQKRAGAA